MSTNCISSRAGDAARAAITRWRSVRRILMATPSPSGCCPWSMYAAIHSPSRNRRIALRSWLLSPGSASRFGSSTEPKTTYLMSRAGTQRARSASAGLEIGYPSGGDGSGAEWPSSRPPSSRCTATLNLGRRGRGSPLDAGAGVGSGVCSGISGEVVMTSLMWRAPSPWRLAVGMLAPGYGHVVELSTEPFRGPAAVQHPLGAGHPLGHAFDLGRARRQRRGARVAAGFRNDDSNRHRDQRRAQVVAVALLGLDPAAFPVLRVVQRGHCVVESPGHRAGDCLGEAGVGEDHKVVAADVARKVLWRVILFEHLEDDRGERLDHVIAAQEAVMVVVALEGIDVGIQAGEPLVGGEAAAHLSQDVAVSAHAGQRGEGALWGRAAHDGAQARHELLRDERLGDVVVRAREQVLDLVFQRSTNGQKHDRDQARTEVAADLGEDLVARRVAEHQVEQDDVRPRLHRRVMRQVAVADDHALETRALEDTLEQPLHLLVVIDYEDDFAMWHGNARSGLLLGRYFSRYVHDAPESGVGGTGRRSFSVSAIARSAAWRTSWMSVFTAAGSSVSSAISSL